MIDQVEATILPALMALPYPWNLSSHGRQDADVDENALAPSAKVLHETMHALAVSLAVLVRCPSPPTLLDLGPGPWDRLEVKAWNHVKGALSRKILALSDYSRARVREVLHTLSPTLDAHVDLACHVWLDLCVRHVAAGAAHWMERNMRDQGSTPEAAKLLALAKLYDRRVPDSLSLVVISAAAIVCVGTARPFLRSILEDESRTEDAHEQMRYLLAYIDGMENPPPPGVARFPF
jgi:hypothetical protein